MYPHEKIRKELYEFLHAGRPAMFGYVVQALDVDNNTDYLILGYNNVTGLNDVHFNVESAEIKVDSKYGVFVFDMKKGVFKFLKIKFTEKNFIDKLNSDKWNKKYKPLAFLSKGKVIDIRMQERFGN